MNTKFLRCAHCGNIATLVVDKGVPVLCCGEPMGELVANTTDAATEKHVPEVKVNDGKVEVVVGSTVHPMEEKHYIQFIYLATDKGGQIKQLNPGEEPKAVFAVAEGKPVAVFEYCNLHGLWKTEV